MAKWQRRALVGIVCFVALAVGGVVLHDALHERSLQRGLLSSNERVRVESLEALLKLGVMSSSDLRAVCERHPRGADSRLALRAMSRLPRGAAVLAEMLEASRGEWRWHVIEALESMGPGAVSAVDALSSCLQDDTWAGQHRALEALVAIGPAARSSLLELLAVEDSGVQGLAMRGLRELGPESVPDLVQYLKHRSPMVRFAAAYTLGEFGEGAAASVEALRGLLRDGDIKVRWAAAFALSRLGEAGEVALPELIGMLGDSDAEVRRRADEAVTSFGVAAVGPLMAVIDDVGRGEELRVAAIDSLRTIVPVRSEVVVALLRYAGDGRAGVRLAALLALEEMERLPPEAKPVLERAVRDEVEAVRHAARRVLSALAEAR